MLIAASLIIPSALAHAASNTVGSTPGTYWYRCTLHLDWKTATRIVARECHTYVIHRHHPRRVGWRVTRTRVSPHVIIGVRYPIFQQTELPGCYWPEVRVYSAYIYAAARASGIPAGWIAATIETESSGDPTSTSPGGDGADVGLMQYGPAEAADVNGYYGYDPRLNILTGSLFLAYLLHHYAGGSLWMASAMYNGGPGNPNGNYADIVAGRVCG